MSSAPVTFPPSTSSPPYAGRSSLRTRGTPPTRPRVALAYTEDSRWRNRDEFFQGRDAIRAFLERKWARELDYRLRKEL